VRQEALYSAEVNGHFLCDRGRFGFYYTEDPFRPRKACFGPREASLTEALAVGREGLRGVAAAHGPEAVALAAGMGCSLETLYAAQRLCNNSGWPAPSFFPQAAVAERIESAVHHLDEPLALSLGAVAEADFILVVGGDPLNEAPMLALALRQAQRKGAAVGVIDPRPVALPLAFTHLAAHPGELDQCLGALFKASVEGWGFEWLDEAARAFHRQLPDLGACREAFHDPVDHLVQRLRRARRPLIVCGSELVSPATPALAAEGCRLLRAMDQAAHLFYMLPEANSFGAALLGGGDFDQTLTNIESGRVKALILVEWDPLRDHPDGRRVANALARLDLLVVLDHVATAVGDQAQILLPTATIYESGGLFINHEGRLQQSWPAGRGGISVAQTGGGGHPPRVYSNEIPGGDPCPAWRLLAQLGPDPAPAAVALVDELLPAIGLPADGPIPAEGVRVRAAAGAGPQRQPSPGTTPGQIPEGFELLTTAWTFGTEPLAALSPPLRQIEAPPHLAMHRADAAGLGIQEGDQLSIQTAGGNLTLAVRLCDNMARGVLIVPRHHRLAWQVLATAGNPIGAYQISKTAGRR
jgi:NADH-quinone oxidoreductase subunit G